jgi:hypothetical protein
MSITIITDSNKVSGSSPYDSGYDHGCDDAKISDPSDRYINQPEKDPSFHTDEFMNGYNEGYNTCHINSEVRFEWDSIIIYRIYMQQILYYLVSFFYTFWSYIIFLPFR